jgi:hypothetical protein
MSRQGDIEPHIPLCIDMPGDVPYCICMIVQLSGRICQVLAEGWDIHKFGMQSLDDLHYLHVGFVSRTAADPVRAAAKASGMFSVPADILANSGSDRSVYLQVEGIARHPPCSPEAGSSLLLSSAA